MKARLSTTITSIIESKSERPYRRPRAFHASGLRECGRRQVLGLMGIVEPERGRKPEWDMAAEVGNLIHDHITALAKERGILEAAELPLGPTEDAFVSGRVDAILNRNGKRRVLEIKSMNAKGFATFYPGGSDRFEDAYAQTQFYLWRLNLDSGYILAIDRDTCVKKEFAVEYDDNYLLSLLARIRRLKDMLDRGTLPEPERSKCSFCGHKGGEHCKSEEDDWLSEQAELV